MDNYLKHSSHHSIKFPVIKDLFRLDPHPYQHPQSKEKYILLPLIDFPHWHPREVFVALILRILGICV